MAKQVYARDLKSRSQKKGVRVRFPLWARKEKPKGVVAQLARALDLHSKSRGFESHLLHFVMIRKNDGTDAKYEMETTEARIKEWI